MKVLRKIFDPFFSKCVTLLISPEIFPNLQNLSEFFEYLSSIRRLQNGEFNSFRLLKVVIRSRKLVHSFCEGWGICRHLLLKLNTGQYLIYIFIESWSIFVTTALNFTWILIDNTFARVNRKPFNNKTRDKTLEVDKSLSHNLHARGWHGDFRKMFKLFLKQPSPIWARVSFVVMLLSIALASWLIRNRGSENLVREPVVEENAERPSRLPRIDPIQVSWNTDELSIIIHIIFSMLWS